MLYQFEVSGFKSFNEKFSFRLDGAKEYSFNREAVRNDVIKTGIVYGVTYVISYLTGRYIADEYNFLQQYYEAGFCVALVVLSDKVKKYWR